MIKIILIILIGLIILSYKKRETFICNIPFRTSSKCFDDKYQTCLNEIRDKFYCQDLANLECTVPPTVSSRYPGIVKCL